MANTRVIKPRLMKDARRKCGHPFQPTFDVIAVDGMSITSFCINCMMEKLGLKPCSKCRVNKPDDWRDPERIIWVFNE